MVKYNKTKKYFVIVRQETNQKISWKMMFGLIKILHCIHERRKKNPKCQNDLMKIGYANKNKFKSRTMHTA